MASVVQICNLALLKFGDISISQIDTPTTEAERACKVLYPLLRDELVAAHPWNFAMKRADISALLTITPAFGFDYAYTLPTDCLRVWEFYGKDDAEWVVENGLFLTNEEEEIYIRYISQVTEAGRFPPSFVECLATRLGAELAAKIADDRQMRQQLLQELFQVHLPHARTVNAIEGNKPRHTNYQPLDYGAYSWQIEGR